MLVSAFLCASCSRDRGCSAHPVFPAPSDFWGPGVLAKLRAHRAARTRRRALAYLSRLRGRSTRAQRAAGGGSSIHSAIRFAEAPPPQPSPASGRGRTNTDASRDDPLEKLPGNFFALLLLGSR